MCKNAMLEALKEAIDEEVGENKIVEKSVPAKKEWIKDFEELETLKLEIKKMMNKMEHKRDALWARIREELDAYGVDHMRFNEEAREIEYLAERE